MRDQFILKIKGKTIAGYTSFSQLMRVINEAKDEWKHRRVINSDPDGVLDFGDTKIEKTKLIISKRKSIIKN